MSDLWAWPLAELVAALRDGRLTPAEVVEAFLARAEAADEMLACFIELRSEQARVAARDCSRLPADGRALHGVPFAHKDVFAGDGVAPSSAAKGVRLRLRAARSAVLDRLGAAGAISLGTLNLDPFGYAATGVNPDYGTTRNPWDPARIAGGSSSGAAAAVAAGAVPFAIGSDTGGSVRIPATLCGVTGLKPTLGRIPKGGLVPLAYSQDTLGIIARSALDVALVLEQVAGYDPLDPSSAEVDAPPFHARIERALDAGPAPLAGLRVGVDDVYVAQHASADIAAGIRDAVARMEALGATVVDVALDCLERYDVVATVLTWAEVAAVHGPTFLRDRDRYAPATRARLELALAADGADHVNALRYQGYALREFLDGPLGSADVLAVPAAPSVAPLLASVDHGSEVDAVSASVALLRLNRPFNLIGVPALAVPMGFDALGLPMGFQLVGRPWAEETLLTTAAALQQVTSWHAARPPEPQPVPASP